MDKSGPFFTNDCKANNISPYHVRDVGLRLKSGSRDRRLRCFRIPSYDTYSR